VSNPDADRLGGPSWSVADFSLVILAGLAGAFLAAAWLIVAEPSDAWALIVASLAMSGGHLLGLGAVFRRHRASSADLGLEVRPEDGRYLFAGAILQIGATYLFAPLAELVESEGSTQVALEQIAVVEGTLAKAMVVLVVGLVSPAVEELVFRGLLLRALEQRMRAVPAVVVSAVVFGAIHIFGLDTANPLAGAITIAELFVVGLVLGELTRRTGRLGPAVFTHAGFNLLAVVVLIFAPEILGN
jgi:hypothetical protein